MNTPEQVPKHDRSAKSWLDTIQQDSWQLELLISGFVIFLLIGGWSPLAALEYDVKLMTYVSSSFSTLAFIYYLGRTAYLSLLLCLLVHVALRGVWIAAVGLRSVSGEIDIDSLNFKPRFARRLRQGIGSFDDYIDRLERYCSVIFSVAFLILFCFFSLVSWSLAAIVIQWFYLLLSRGEWQGNGILGGAGTVSIMVVVLSLVYFIDFITLGWLKKLRWVNRPYYYLYVFMGWVTLARLYRPLYYNLVDHRFGRRLAVLLPVIVLLILVGVSIEQVKYAYFPALTSDGKVWQDANNYDDENGNELDRIWRMTLSSKHVTNGWVEAFMPYTPRRDNDALLLIDPELEVSQYTGTKLRGAFTMGRYHNPEADYDRILTAFSKKYQLFVNDSLYNHVAPLFHFHEQRRQPGVVYMIPVHDLPDGRHELMLKTRIIKADTLQWAEGRTIYFYK